MNETKKQIFTAEDAEQLFSDRLFINGTGGPITEKERQIWKLGFKRGRNGWSE